MNVTASKPGEKTPKIEKRTLDSVVCSIDVTPLLDKHELVYGAVSVTFPAPLEITEQCTKQGKLVSFRASSGPVDMPFAEYVVAFSVGTSKGNRLSVPVILKVYSV